jgi:hypothetical protein
MQQLRVFVQLGVRVFFETQADEEGCKITV